MTEPLASMTYSTVVTRESVRIAFMLASLNDLNVKAADISNAKRYGLSQAPNSGATRVVS
jgi:hypothetical protein